MKRIIISISAALVVLTALYIFVDRSALFFRRREIANRQIRDLVGRTVEAEYEQTAGLVALGLRRKLEIEDKKLDYLLGGISTEDLHEKKIPAFERYVAESRFCQKITVFDAALDILSSTSLEESPNEKLLERILASGNTVATDPENRRIIFIKEILSESTSSLRVLFYYSSELFVSLFREMDTLEYEDFVILKHDLVLVNFPEVDRSDEANADRLYELFLEDRGGVRVEVEGSDVTVYYTSVDEPYDNLILGLAAVTEGIGISPIGLAILISQTVVVLSLIIFIFVSIGQKRGRPVGMIKPAPEGEVPGAGMEETEELPVVAEEEGVETLEDVSAPEAGIISLADVEEVTEVEEIGEAEVAEEVETLEPEMVDEKKPPASPEPEVAGPDAEHRQPSGGTAQGISVKKDERKKRKGEERPRSEDIDRVERIEDDLAGLETEKTLPDLGELVKGRLDGTGEQAALLDMDAESAGGPIAPVLIKEPEPNEDLDWLDAPTFLRNRKAQ